MRKFFALLCAFLLILLAGCGAQATGEPDDGTSNPGLPITEEYRAPDTVVLEIKARLADSTDRSWHTGLTVHDGDVVELQCQYVNWSETDYSHVYVGFTLPDGLEYVPETFTLYNTEFYNGIRFKGDISSVNIGQYSGITAATPEGKPGSNAYCRIQVTVHSDKATTLPIYFTATSEGTDDTVHITSVSFQLEIK